MRAQIHRVILRTVELLIQELRLQRDAQLRHFEALETRAGIVLGFAGAVATFSPLGGPLGIAGRALSLLAALLALASFVPRGFPLFDVSALLRAMAGRDEPQSVERHVEWLARSSERAGGVLRTKSRALALAVVFIVSATVILGGGIIVAGGNP